MEKLIAKRKESIKALDELLKSIFQEMFGDPTKPKSTDIVQTIEETCQFKGGGTPSKAKPEYFTGNIPWVSPKDMKSLYVYTSIDKITKEAIINSSTNLIPKGSVLMVVRSGILKNKLPVAINTVDVTINQDMKAFTSKVVLAPYLLYFFISNEKIMLKKVRATTADNFNFEDIKKMKIMIPPIPLQHQFAAIVEKVESLKAKHTQSLTELENLYGSLSQQAFKGKLDLSKVPVGKEEPVTELPEEGMGASSMASELSISKIYSEAELLRIMQSLSGETFSFGSLITELEKASFEEMPNYEKLKAHIYKMLEGQNPLLSQTLGEVKNESGKVEKKIVLRVNK